MKKIKIPLDIYKRNEYELFNYKTLLKKIKEREDVILHSSPSNDGQPRGNQTTDTTGNTAQRLIEDKVLNTMRARLEPIERMLNTLSEEEKEFFEFIFIKKKTWQYFEINLYISRPTYYRIKRKLITMLALEEGDLTN